MKKAYQLLLISLVFTTLSVSAQKAFQIKGVVLDSISTKPVDYLTVSLKSSTNAVLKSTLSKTDGTFLISNLSIGKYTLIIVGMSYRLKAIELNLTNSTSDIMDLGVIRLSGSSKQLKEVVVNAERPIVKQEIDRISYDVEADPESKGQNMLEIMNKVPLLSIDGEQTIKLKGSTDFKIYINGRPSGVMAQNPAMALRVMRASNVQKVEVITTPSSKYDSEGAAGIINIVTKENTSSGYNIIVEALRNSKSYRGLGAAFVFKEGKFGMNGYAGYWIRNMRAATFTNIWTNTGGTSPFLVQNGNSKPTGPHVPFNADLSFEIDSLNLISGTIALVGDKIGMFGLQSFSRYKATGELEQSSEISNTNKTDNLGMDLSINYQRSSRKKKDQIFTASYILSNYNSKYAANNQVTSRFNFLSKDRNQKNKSGFNEQAIQLDYVTPVKKVNIEGGVKFISRDNYSAGVTDLLDQSTITDSFVNDFEYRQDVYSLYNSYHLKLETWGLKAGLRLEMTSVDGLKTYQQYQNLIPSLAVQRKLKNMGSLNLGFTRRIQRPAILQLDPFENQSNALYFTSGNPNLIPALSNNFDLSYTQIKKATVNVAVNYSFSENTIQNLVATGTDGITRLTFGNIGKYDNVGANLSINYPVNTRLSLNINGRVQYSKLQSLFDNSGYRNDGFNSTVNTTLNYKFKNDWVFTTRFNASSSTVNLQGETSGFTAFYMRLSKEFFNKKLGFITSTFSPLQRYRTVTKGFQTPGGIQTSVARNDIRLVYFNVYYTFGKLKDKIKKAKKGIVNDDVEKSKSDL